MDGVIHGVLGGIVPTVALIIVYFVSMAGRLSRIETNIEWLIKESQSCRPHSKDHTP